MTRSLTRYSAVAIGLHWLIALLILGNIALAWVFQNIPQGLLEFQLFQWHKSIGITVLLLSVARLLWRLANPPPAAPPMPDWQRIAANLVHWGFYVVMIAMPLSGWIIVSASKLNLPTLLYGVVPWPHLPFVHDAAPAAKSAWGHRAGTAHGLLAKLAYVLIVLHVAAALKHQFFDRDDLIRRMLPLWRRKEPANAV